LIRKGEEEEYKNAHYQDRSVVILSSVGPVNEAQLAVSLTTHLIVPEDK